MVFAERVELHLVGIEKTFPASFSQQDSATGFYMRGGGLLLLNMMIPKMLIGWEKLNNH